jgi:predicted DNA binding CopG/RHH family protein
MNAKRRDYEELPDEELPPELDAKARALIDLAERELEETRVNFRWGKLQVDTVKRAAALAGVPYQTYIKQIVFRQAVADLRAAEGVVKAS